MDVFAQASFFSVFQTIDAADENDRKCLVGRYALIGGDIHILAGRDGIFEGLHPGPLDENAEALLLAVLESPGLSVVAEHKRQSMDETTQQDGAEA